MKIFIAGGTGFVGKNLINRLCGQGHEVTALVRTEKKLSQLPASVSPVLGSPMKSGEWQNVVNDQDVFINLTGANIFTRWNEKNKRLLRDSRIISTKNIVDAIASENNDGKVLINAGAVGFYGMQCKDDIVEGDHPGEDFLARLCVDWEAEALKAEAKNVRVVLTRCAVVLGKGDGALERMLPAFKLGFGGPLGNGRQWFPWIHIDDLVSAILFCIETRTIKGPVNCCAPQIVTNREFSRELGKALHRPAMLPVPAFIIRLVFGEMGSVVLNGCRIVPQVLEQNHFNFEFSTLPEALSNLVS